MVFTVSQNCDGMEVLVALLSQKGSGREHGVPGAGKTRSAREYASWDALASLFPEELFTLVGRHHLDDKFPISHLPRQDLPRIRRSR